MRNIFIKWSLTLALGALIAGGQAWAHGSGSGYRHARPVVRVAPIVRPYYHGPRVWVPPAVVYGSLAYPWSPLYGPAPYYGAPAVVAVPTEPPVYVEQAATDPRAYWYWCASPEGYHPTVADCPGGWQPVPAKPAAQP